MKYRVEVAIGDFSFEVVVEADSVQDAYGEAEEKVRHMSIEATAAVPEED